MVKIRLHQNTPLDTAAN